MNIYACIKQVPDTEATLQVEDGKRIKEEGIKWIISPYDEYAVEEALKLKEKVPGSSVTVVTLGPKRVESALRSGLAMGAQNALHIEAEEPQDHKTIARALANAIKQDDDFGVVFMGKQAIDDDSYLTHIYLAEYLGAPAATNVVAFSYEDGTVTVEREIDEGGLEKIEMQVPCVVAATRGLNTPRYASLMGIMKAKKIPIKTMSLAEAGVPEPTVKIRTEKLSSPPEKPEGKIIGGDPAEAVKELIRLLKEEAKVL
ncbi:MAG: electron transfer flavoprotein subunit beta/FixA family protein [bacterium]|nr:electron transfer flavoprotein subunit beta/FixA family protein [bacterium]